MSFIDTLMSTVALGSSEVASEMMMKIDILHVLDTSVCAPTHQLWCSCRDVSLNHLSKHSSWAVLLYASRNTSEIC